MKILLDTNIIFQKEISFNVNEDVDVLFKWIENSHHTKCVHPISLEFFNKCCNPNNRETIKKKLRNYNILEPITRFGVQLKDFSKEFDKCEDDINATILLNELFIGRVDLFITEEEKTKQKASLLGLRPRVFSINSFLEKVITENSEFNYFRTLSLKKEFFEDIDINNNFFESLKKDYSGFSKWFAKKKGEIAYTCKSDKNILAFLYLKIENENENYNDISPGFDRKKRLKIGTFKVALNGFRLGERFLKIIFDTAIFNDVGEIYLSLFKKNREQERLIRLLKDFGFIFHGYKTSAGGKELVYVKKLNRVANRKFPKITYPFISTLGKIFIVPICSDRHSELFSDHILSNESPIGFQENDPIRNRISKVYISNPFSENLKSGDVILFCLVGKNKTGSISIIGIVENIINGIKSKEEFTLLYSKRFSLTELQQSNLWNYKTNNTPFLINFLQVYSLPKKVTVKKLIKIGLISKKESILKDFKCISKDDFKVLLRESKANDSLIVD